MKIKMCWLVFFTIFATAGCVSTAVVEDAVGNEPINTVSMSCSEPYEFTQDCSIWDGATRRIKVEGFEVRIAGSKSGSEVLVMDANFLKNSFSDFFLLNSPAHSLASNNSYNVVKKLLHESGVVIIKVVPLRSFGNVNGYVLELDADGYSKLISYAAEE